MKRIFVEYEDEKGITQSQGPYEDINTAFTVWSDLLPVYGFSVRITEPDRPINNYVRYVSS